MHVRLKRRFRRHRKAIVAGGSGLLYAGGWSLGAFTPMDTVSAAILVLGAIVGGYDIAKAALGELRSRTVGIKTLVTLAAIGAVLIGEYWEAAAVVFLFALGSYLEGRTMRKTRGALQELLELSPDTAVVKRNGEQVEVPAREVESGETVIVRPGDRIAVDGEVLDGESAVNQAPVTGESAPVHKSPEDEVFAGTVNQDGALEVLATGTGTDTTLQQIIRRVEAAQEAQAPTETIIERFATYYTPAIIVLALGAYIVTRDALMSLTLLVIGCPGALVIGPPVSVVSAIGNAARKGILLKGGEHIETAGTIDLVAFDKTGTLTTGEPTVVDVEGFGAEPKSVLRIASAAEKRSEHHLADAIIEAAAGDRSELAADGGTLARRDAIPEPESFEVVAGKGIVARVEGQEVLVGNPRLHTDRGVELSSAVSTYLRDREERGETVVIVATEGSIVGALSLRDEIRRSAQSVVARLRDTGIRTVMLTGDNERTARSVANEVGVDDYRAEMLPAEKQAAISGFRGDGYVVAMVGDGINDAPSLATADVGIAMGAAGTDTAIETADIALMADDLERIPDAISLSKATRRNIVENVGIAVLTVVILLTGVLAGRVHLAGGMLVHEGSVLLVILNGMRLLYR